MTFFRQKQIARFVTVQVGIFLKINKVLNLVIAKNLRNITFFKYLSRGHHDHLRGWSW
jgi:hypothetical protein